MTTENLQHFIDTLKSKLANERDENARLQTKLTQAEHERKTYWECYQRAFAVYRCMKERADRLQTRVEEAERNLDTEQTYTSDLEATLACDYCSSPLDHAKHLSLDLAELRTERDRYKARDKLRGEALERIEDMTIDYVATDKAAGHIAKVAHAARNAPLEKGKAT